MKGPGTRSTVLKHYEGMPKNVQEYFKHLPQLLEHGFPLDVCLSYLFGQVELAHNMTLYCAVVKKHRANTRLARNVIDSHHMTRAGFKDLFSTVIGKSIPGATMAHLEQAQAIRDKILHGTTAREKDKRRAIVSVLTYSSEFNAAVKGFAGFAPFGSLKGFKGRGQSLDIKTTRWVLKGMGFSLS
jgi:hypothetical protein